jgi:hypothetical protein
MVGVPVATTVVGPVAAVWTGEPLWWLLLFVGPALTVWMWRLGSSRKASSRIAVVVDGSVLRLITAATGERGTEFDLAGLTAVEAVPAGSQMTVILRSLDEDAVSLRLPGRVLGAGSPVSDAVLAAAKVNRVRLNSASRDLLTK